MPDTCNSKYTCTQRGIRIQYMCNTRTKDAVCSLPKSASVCKGGLKLVSQVAFFAKHMFLVFFACTVFWGFILQKSPWPGVIWKSTGKYKMHYTHCFFFFSLWPFFGQLQFFFQTQHAVGMVLFQAICGVFLPTVPHCFFFFCSTKTQVCCVFFSFVAFFHNSNHVMNHMLCNGKNAPVIKRTQKNVTKSA